MTSQRNKSLNLRTVFPHRQKCLPVNSTIGCRSRHRHGHHAPRLLQESSLPYRGKAKCYGPDWWLSPVDCSVLAVGFFMFGIFISPVFFSSLSYLLVFLCSPGKFPFFESPFDVFQFIFFSFYMFPLGLRTFLLFLFFSSIPYVFIQQKRYS